MAKVTLLFAVLLIALGLAGYLGTGSQYPTALIPTWFGVALGIFGWLAMSPSEAWRKLFMHINVTIGLLGFLGAGARAIQSYFHARSAGLEPASRRDAASSAIWYCGSLAPLRRAC